MLLRNKDLASLRAIFSEIDMSFEIWAYGSRVSGEAHDGSDLDLVMRPQGLQKTPIQLFVQIKNKIQQSNIPILVDLFDWARLPETFHRNILAQHEVLFSNMEGTVNKPGAEDESVSAD